MRFIFLVVFIVLLTSQVYAAEPVAYDITFFKVENAPQDELYVYNYLMHYEGTQNQSSTFIIDGNTITIQEGQTATYETLEIQITDSSANARITTSTNEQVTGQVAVTHITATSAKQHEEIVVRQGDEIENNIEVTTFGFTQAGNPALQVKKGNIERTIQEGQDVFFAQRRIRVENIVTGVSMSSQQNLISASIEVEEDYDLTNYPDIFAYSDKATYIVSGADAQSYHSFAATDVALSLPQTGQEYHNVLDTDDINANSANLILIGGPCENELTKDILSSLDCTRGLDPGEGKIELVDTGDRTILLIVGYGEKELRFVARELRQGTELEGEQAILTTTPSVQAITAPQQARSQIPERATPSKEESEQIGVLGAQTPQEEITTTAPSEIAQEPFMVKKLPWYKRLWRWIVRTFE